MNTRMGPGFAVLAGSLLVMLGWRSDVVRADRGAIVTLSGVNIEEPAQRAIIVFDGSQEMIILQTDVRAERELKVVEFMPLPSDNMIIGTVTYYFTSERLHWSFPGDGRRAGGMMSSSPVP